jgi:S1-C subfamily serine protease
VHILRLGSPHASKFDKINQDELQVSFAEHTGGVLVTDIKTTSPLYISGLRKGHLVSNMNMAEVNTPKELLDQYRLAEKGPVQMVYYTMSKKMDISVEFGEWE